MMLPTRLLMLPHVRLLRSQVHRCGAFPVSMQHLPTDNRMHMARFFATSKSPSTAVGSAPRRPKLLGNNDDFNPRSPSDVPSDVLYEYNRNRYFTMISSASLLQIAFWSWLKGTEATLPAAPVALPAAALDPSFLSIVTNEAWSTVGLGSSVIMAVVVVFFSQRSISRISVISGGSKLRLTTQKFLGGMSPPLDFPVAQLRAASISDKYISVKVGSELGFYLIDLDGQFYNRAKLDQLLQVPLALGAANAAATTRASSTRPKPKEPFRAPIRTDLPKTEWKKK
ncbi:hypothetical protein H257_08424 [Aphanomyces astaci]|uniref:Uncharacterized protein n=1 Tax=Aphanomyces astaci TaxID=112090 RepID=W4GGS1_APHAT|nr:hypothetical protein H257_08424 [Aphanomyces astaci]ETV78249.1 hypothetical protein H257_08424 [Aphanomyces astaci]|eukprot:XP_009832586.1 hypothetical protein H257_08424 [Aphanomyces astaci]